MAANGSSPKFFKSETLGERKARLARDIPLALVGHEAERRAVDARTAKLRALRLAKEAADAGVALAVKPKKRKPSASSRKSPNDT